MLVAITDGTKLENVKLRTTLIPSFMRTSQLFKKLKRSTHDTQIPNSYLLLKTENVYLNECRAVLAAYLLMVSLHISPAHL
jgi:hypothetical protein